MRFLKLEFAAASHKGKVRATNEDSFVADEKLSLAAVADGMGGHNCGEIASSIAIKTLHEKIYQEYSKIKGNEIRTLQRAVLEANSKIYEFAQKIPESKGMGTTLSAIILKNKKAYFIHLGDSRIYLFRNGTLKQITHDHSLVMEHLKKGLITKELAESSIMQNVLTRAVGIQRNIITDTGTILIKPKDRILLCTDGLFRAVKEPEIEKIIMSDQPADTICRTLLAQANKNGGHDNITAALIKINSKYNILNFLKILIPKI